MKSKKWLTLITLFVSIASLVFAFIIGKNSNSIFYDIAMALFGSALVGFMMSITEYYVERDRAINEFFYQASKILEELRQIKYLDTDAPSDLIVKVFREEQSNELKALINAEACHKAKNELISWYEENIGLLYLGEVAEYNEFLKQIYESKKKDYRDTFNQCMDSYQVVSSIELGELDNAYENLDFIFANRCIRKEVNNMIYCKIVNIISDFIAETYHFNSSKDKKGNFPVCASKVCDLNQKYFSSEKIVAKEYSEEKIYQIKFDDIEESLEQIRCKIHGKKYVARERKPVLIKGESVAVDFGMNEE